MTGALAGRGAELARLEEILCSAIGGAGGVALLIGPPGIGKSALLRATAARAVSTGFALLEGRAIPADRRLAFAPLVDAVGTWLRALPAADRQLLVRGLPPLAHVLLDLDLVPPAPLADPALERTRIVEAFARTLERASLRAPVALVLDDVHHADDATLEALQHIGRRIARQRLVVCLAARDAPTLEALGPVERIELGPLADEALAQLAAGILEGPAPPVVVRLLRERTAGLPSHAEALVRHLRDSGALARRHGAWVAVGDLHTPAALGVTLRQLDEANAAAEPGPATAPLYELRARTRWDLGRSEEAEADLERAQVSLGDGPCDALVDLLHTRAVFAGRRRDLQQLATLARRILPMAEPLGPRARALGWLVAAAAEPVHARAVPLLERALELAELAADRALRARVLDQCSSRAALDGNLLIFERTRVFADDLAADFPVSSIALKLQGVLVDAARGRLDRAESSSRALISSAWELGSERLRLAALAVRALALALTGDAEAAAHCLADADALGLAADRNVADMATIARLEIGWMRPAEPTRLEPPSVVAAILVPWARVAVRGGIDVGAAADEVASTGPEGWPGAAAAHARALQAGDREALLAAAERYDVLGLALEASRARCEAGDAASVAAALAVFDRIGAEAWAEHARAALRALGRPAPTPRVPRTHGLSPRELDVAIQVAHGLTNAEVGRALFISERTVTTHLDRIYRRLGLAGREALASYVREHGLT